MHTLITTTVLTLALTGAACEEIVMQPTTQPNTPIPGYALGDDSLPTAPITLEELAELQKSLLFTGEDVEALRMSRAVLAPHVEELVGVWYGFVGANPHLLKHFTDVNTAEPDADYLARVRARFERWVLDTAEAEYDQDWLDYQFEIGRRHHTSGKNETDGANATPLVEFRHLVALTIPITTTIRPFLERGGHSPEQVEAMHAAWVKSVLMQAILWSYPYVEDGGF
ncbi:MAG: protoglobin domain-containing protein [Phycisphaerales bacterium JB059]